MSRTVYLLHFERRLHHAGHYLGSTDDLTRRLAEHRAGRGARLIEVITEAGIDFVLARTWQGDRNLERRLKRRKEAPRLCPLCQGRPPMVRAFWWARARPERREIWPTVGHVSGASRRQSQCS